MPGASGQTSGGSLNHPAMFVSMNVLGSMVLDIDGDRLDARYLDSTGTIRDYFTVVKGGAPGNVPPTVAITSPANGASFSAPATVAIAATASDSDGSVTRVDFYAGTSLLGSDSTSPYGFSWNGVAAGSYSLTAVATDDDGATRTSSPVALGVTGSGSPVTVSFRNGSAGYTGMDDASLRSDGATTNYGSATVLLGDGSPDYAAAMRWNLTSIPAGKVVTQVQLTLRVSNASSGSYELYALKQPWVESQVTWQRTSTALAWQTAGANGANDRESTVLGSFTPSATGSYTITLNAAGVAKVQAWINSPSSNHGLVLLDYAVSDGVDLRSSEYGTVSQRPQLTVTYQ